IRGELRLLLAGRPEERCTGPDSAAALDGSAPGGEARSNGVQALLIDALTIMLHGLCREDYARGRTLMTNEHLLASPDPAHLLADAFSNAERNEQEVLVSGVRSNWSAAGVTPDYTIWRSKVRASERRAQSLLHEGSESESACD